MLILGKRIFVGPTPSKVFGLDVLRSLAIIGVLFSHAQLVIPEEKRGWLGTFSNLGGYLGVELFFVLSGFLIGSIILSFRGEFEHFAKVQNFWIRRWLRTLPNYVLFLLLTMLMYYFLAWPIPNISSFIIFSQNLVSPHPQFFGQAWSLSIEEWFYLLFPLVIYIIYKWTKSFDLSFILAICIFIIFPTIIRFLKAMEPGYLWDQDFRKITLLRLDAIMYGIIMAWIKKTYPVFWTKIYWPSFISGIILLIISWGFNFNESHHNIVFRRTLLFSLTSIGFGLVIPLFDQWQNNDNKIIPNIFRNLANWSYSLYLCNYMVIIGLLLSLQDGSPKNIVYRLVYMALFFIASIVISCLVYTYFEKPIMDLRKRI